MAKKIENKKTLVLLDTHAIIHRAYHALPEFTNSKGEPTGALYGLATMLFKIITELKPDYIVACYDLPKKTFRHEAYEGYKAGRAKTDDALIAQIIKSRDFFKALSIPIYEHEGYEADDMLGTIAEQCKRNKDIDVVIASGDMDTLQLVLDNKVQVYTLKKGINDTILYNEEKVKERFGFLPKYLPDYKGLRGDPSDNIIGIKGIGEKTATSLIVEYGTIEELYKSINKHPEKVKALGITDRIFKLLKDNEEEAIFSKTLATIRLDAPIKFELPGKIWMEEVVKEDVAGFLREMEFKSLQNRFLNLFGSDESAKDAHATTTPKTNSKEDVDPVILSKAKIALWLLNSEKTNPNLEDIVYYKNSKSLVEAIGKLEEDIKKENLSYVYENIEIPIISIIDSMEKVGIKVDLQYLEKLSNDYHKELFKIEKSIWQKSGREFNVNSPKQLAEILFDEMKIQDSKDSKGQASKFRMKKTAGGARSTRESELEKLKDLNPIIKEILEYRELQKLLSTYIDTIKDQVASDGRLHAQFIQTGSTTGRFSSNNPNLQNIPIKTERGKNIRNAFIAEDGYVLASFDYSQIELRVAALLSQDSYFIKVFKDGGDIHNAVAMKVFNVGSKEVTADMRRQAKVINFGILYGMGVNALKENLGSTRAEAQTFYDNYFAQFPTIASYLESIKDFAKAHGYTETLFGRKRYFPGIRSSIPFIKAMAERMAINAPIQGTATADIIKIGMKKVNDCLEKEGILEDVRLVLQVHDELVYEIKKESLKQAQSIIEQAMRDVIPKEFLINLDHVPLLVSIASGPNWGVLK